MFQSGTESSSPQESTAQSPSSLDTRSKENVPAPSRSESVKIEKKKSGLNTPEERSASVKSGRRSKSPQKTVQVKTPEEQKAEEQDKQKEKNESGKEWKPTKMKWQLPL